MADKLSADKIEDLERELHELDLEEAERNGAWRGSEDFQTFHRWYREEHLQQLRANNVKITDETFSDLDRQWKQTWLWRTYGEPREKKLQRAAKIRETLSQHDSLDTKIKPQQRKTPLTDRAHIIRKVSRLGFKGPGYCEQLRLDGLKPPESWKGCPSTYPQAYKLPKWAKKINDEKYRNTKKKDRSRLTTKND